MLVDKNKSRTVISTSSWKISLVLGYQDKWKFTSSGPSYYVGLGPTSMTFSTIRRLNKKYKESTDNTKVSPQYFMRILEEFKDVPSLRYSKRQVKNDPNEAYFFLAKQMYHIIKNKRHVLLRKKMIKSGIINNKSYMKLLSL